MDTNLTHKNVVNLSDMQLSEHHISVLTRGLKFCPTPGPPDPGELRDDMDRMHKRLRQIALYEGSESDTGDLASTPVTPTPPVNLVDNLHSFEPVKHRKFKLGAPGQGPPARQISRQTSINIMLDPPGNLTTVQTYPQENVRH